MDRTRKNWNPMDVEGLLNLICKYPCLRTTGNVNFKNTVERNMALNIIAQKMKMPKMDIIKKYRTLRAQYKQYKHQRRTIKNGKWRFYDAMEFLMCDRKSQVKLLEAIEETNESDANLNRDANAKGTGKDKNYTDTLSMGSVESISKFVPKAISSKLQFQNNETKPTKLLEEKTFNLCSKKEAEPSRDEHALLGEYIACELRRLKNQSYLQRELKCSILEAALNINRAQ